MGLGFEMAEETEVAYRGRTHGEGELSVLDAVRGRRAVRQFLPEQVPLSVVRDILAEASRAPSGTNLQPWLVHVVTGAARDRLSRAVIAAAKAGEASMEYEYVANPLWEPYLSRRRKVGHDLYELYGIERHDKVARHKAELRNFEFFGAPVGLFFVMERAMADGSWLDLGMFMQNVMLVARAYGLESCAQQAWCHYGKVLHRELAIDDRHVVACGMSLGYEDKAAKANRLVTVREPVDAFTRFHS